MDRQILQGDIQKLTFNTTAVAQRLMQTQSHSHVGLSRKFNIRISRHCQQRVAGRREMDVDNFAAYGQHLMRSLATANRSHVSKLGHNAEANPRMSDLQHFAAI